LLVPGDGGTIVNLTGKIYHDDCTTPLVKATIDLWHCGPDGQYDNTTQEFRIEVSV
jgi:protocatechuate 3,4-dioxygenase beta subunit